jgi:hypothetical protein
LFSILSEITDITRYCKKYDSIFTPDNYKIIQESDPTLYTLKAYDYYNEKSQQTFSQMTNHPSTRYNIVEILQIGHDNLKKLIKLLIHLEIVFGKPSFAERDIIKSVDHNFNIPNNLLRINFRQCELLLHYESQILNFTRKEFHISLTQFATIINEFRKCKDITKDNREIDSDINDVIFNDLSMHLNLNPKDQSIILINIGHFQYYVNINELDDFLQQTKKYMHITNIINVCHLINNNINNQTDDACIKLKIMILEVFHDYIDKQNRLKYIYEKYGTSDQIYETLNKMYEAKLNKLETPKSEKVYKPYGVIE